MADLSGVTENFFATASETFEDNLSGSISAGAATVPVNDASAYDDGDVAAITVDPGTVNEATFIGVKQGNQFEDCVWTEGNVGVGHSGGAQVVDYTSATHQSAMVKGLLQVLNQAGQIKNTAETEDGRVVSQFSPVGLVSPYAGASAPSGWLLCDGSAVSRTTYADLYAEIGEDFGAGNGTTTFNLPDLRGRFPLGVGTGTWNTSFAAAAVTVASNEITVTASPEFITGRSVVLSTSGGAPGGLTAGNTYYIVVVNATTIKLASSLSNAINGTTITITTQGTGTHTLTHTLSARALADHGGGENHALRLTEMASHSHGVDSGHSGAGSLLDLRFSAQNNAGAGVATGSGPNTNNAGGNTAHNNMPPYLALNYIIKT